jgi:hypothetical protein
MSSMNMARRRALQVLGAAMVTGAAGQLLLTARAKAPPQGAATTPGAQAFRTVSAILTGKAELRPALALALYEAFVRTTPGVDAALAALQAALTTTLPRDDGRTAFPDAQKAQQGLAQAILQAWYLGTVGKGKKAVCITYIDALANRAVAGELTPPSYSYGPCGSWRTKP